MAVFFILIQFIDRNQGLHSFDEGPSIENCITLMTFIGLCPILI
jgi:hypothetical protein